MPLLPRAMSFALLLAVLAATPQLAAAQEGGFPVATTASSQFVLLNGAVVHRQGTQTTALSQNVRLAGGTKINVKSGIVELPGGKMTTLREGDYVKPDGGIVFATPASAAAARGEQASSGADTPYDKLVQGPISTNDSPAEARANVLGLRVQLLNRKVELLNQKSRC
ncbi:DUF6799 domain-containing protein [uncultured Hymenobacter sp.]|uniref:DUF6799 domain-containing protein n=1 Tax=uncultured Hymenobacter sp. TaxID=170016 RepID=UPI0035CAB7C6